ncbi:MAG: hypothetical protein RBS96_06910 [Dehalococcoidales bacterium]|jgi:hypothetical protein|nr:hypothetical protein [Dehalococcoidales bacterium]
MRTTAAEVKEIMQTGLTETQILPFLTTANAMVTARLATSGLTDTTLEEIEKYLAAHLASVKSKFAITERIGEASITTGYRGGLGLDATPYGEVAKMLDTTGTLATALSMRTAKIEAIEFALDDDD